MFSSAAIDPASTPDLNYNHDSDGLPDAKFEFKMGDTLLIPAAYEGVITFSGDTEYLIATF